jgi:hypothetical protein
MLSRRQFSQKLAPGAPSGCSFSENICTIPKALDFTYNQALTARCLPRIAKGIKKMHWLQVFIMGWLFFGLTTVFFLFWLCKRTAAAVKDPVKAGSLSPPRAEFDANKLSSELHSA